MAYDRRARRGNHPYLGARRRRRPAMRRASETATTLSGYDTRRGVVTVPSPVPPRGRSAGSALAVRCAGPAPDGGTISMPPPSVKPGKSGLTLSPATEHRQPSEAGQRCGVFPVVAGFLGRRASGSIFLRSTTGAFGSLAFPTLGAGGQRARHDQAGVPAATAGDTTSMPWPAVTDHGHQTAWTMEKIGVSSRTSRTWPHSRRSPSVP